MLKNGGFVSHQIDFRCHAATKEWNGHWAISDLVWKIRTRGLPFYINREPLSTHIKLLKQNGFEIIFQKPVINNNNKKLCIRREQLQKRFRNMSDDDFNTSGCYIIANKNPVLSVFAGCEALEKLRCFCNI